MSAIITIRAVEADQRFAFAAENVDPQPWLWEVHTEHYYEGGYAAFRWCAVLWSRYWAWSFGRRERMLAVTRSKASSADNTPQGKGEAR